MVVGYSAKSCVSFKIFLNLFFVIIFNSMDWLVGYGYHIHGRTDCYQPLRPLGMPGGYVSWQCDLHGSDASDVSRAAYVTHVHYIRCFVWFRIQLLLLLIVLHPHCVF